jgi:CO/xanthine dehydrogenase Mo-binding subunit
VKNKAMIGEGYIRLDALEKVTGAAKYPDDLCMDNMLYARILRSPHPHARIKNIDLSGALKLPGVYAAVCGDDIHGPGYFGISVPDQPVLARRGSKVLYVGDNVAAVAAESPQILEAALDAIVVEYNVLPAVTEPRQAILPESLLLHEKRSSNILKDVKVRRGDTAQGFSEAAIVLESSYSTPFVEHAYLQPESGMAVTDENGKITIWTATQWLDEDRRQIAYALGLPMSQVREVAATVGGAFGGREDLSVQAIVALLAMKTKLPVKMTYSRRESITASTKRHPFEMVYRIGADRAGKLTAAEIQIVSNAGAYTSTSSEVLDTAVMMATGAYIIPNVSLDAMCVFTNNPPAGAMRGFGSNQPNFAVEMQMNKLAEALGLDPFEVRRKNLIRTGSQMLTGETVKEGIDVLGTLEAAVERANIIGLRWGRKRVHGKKRYGVGLACGIKNVGYSLGYDDHSEVVVEAYPDRAILKTGACEIGQGSTTVLAQIAASQLELPLEVIQVVWQDSDLVPDSGSSSASRQTFLTGNATLRASAEAALKLAQLGPYPSPDKLPVITKYDYHGPRTFPMDPTTGQSVCGNFAYGYSAQVVEVEVDTETGEVHVLKAVSAVDTGQTINPKLVEGQVEGGFVMGQGYTLMEEYKLRDGKPLTDSLTTYLIPTFLDAPSQIHTVIVETQDPDGPFGVKGIGEMTMLPTPGAIGAAIYDALGVWIDHLPMSPELILSAMGTLIEQK